MTLTVLACLLIGSVPGVHAQSSGFADPAFQQLWERTDAAVKAGRATNSWLWGPEPLSPSVHERYDQAPGATRLVQYFDKARMEINNPNANRGAVWFVTNGLLPIELITGRLQVGDAQFEQRQPATISAVGDEDNPFPTYADLQKVFTRQGSGDAVSTPVTRLFNRDGSIGRYEGAQNDPATRVAALENGHGIPAGFLSYMNQQSGPLGRLFVFGYPVSGAHWVTAKVAGREQTVLFQVFERRVLTYTPNNPAAFRVEAGNVGRHYLRWRYAAPTVEVLPPQGPAGTTFTVRVTGLPKDEQATVGITPSFGSVSTSTIVGDTGPVTTTIPTDSVQSPRGTWSVGVARTAISPIIITFARFVVTAP
jgi:hypothetical protein